MGVGKEGREKTMGNVDWDTGKALGIITLIDRQIIRPNVKPNLAFFFKHATDMTLDTMSLIVNNRSKFLARIHAQDRVFGIGNKTFVHEQLFVPRNLKRRRLRRRAG